MKVFAIPAATSALTAGFSVLFFIGLSRAYGDASLGRIIIVQASAALIQMTCIPSSWVYLLGADGRSDLVARYSRGQTVEWAGTACGVMAIGAAWAMSVVRAPELLIAFLGLSVAASSSCLGYLLATGDWRRYVTWVLTPNLIRLPLVCAMPALAGAGLVRDLRDEPAAIMACYFLMPELVRLLAIAVPLALSTFEWQGVASTLASARHVLQNWVFDVGTAVTDQTDKLLVGALLGPQVLVAYFFGRRLGGLAVMVTEPVYWESYHRSRAGGEHGDLKRTWLTGVASAVALWLLLATAVWLAVLVPPVARFLPAAIVALFGVFVMVMLLDSVSAANRWSRYLARAAGRPGTLLIARLSVFAVFAASLALLAPRFPAWGVVLAMLTALLCETAVVRWLQRTVESDRTDDRPGPAS